MKLFFVCAAVAASAVVCGCSSSTSLSSSAGTVSASRALNAFTSSTGTTVTSYFENPLTNQVGSSQCNTDFSGAGTNCTQTTRQCGMESIDTSSCQNARESLGIGSGSISNLYLKFSCNVVEGLATSSCTTSGPNTTCTSTTNSADATYVSLTTTDLPDYATTWYGTNGGPTAESGSYSFTANGYTVTGTFSSLFSYFSTPFPDPSENEQESITMYIPISPVPVGTTSPGTSQPMGMGAVGMAINGVMIFDNLAAGTDNIFAEDGSFDECGGHPANGMYHYHAEPAALTNAQTGDDNLVGVMEDGYFVYGREDSGGTVPGSLANQVGASSGYTNTIYFYGGHVGVPPTGGSSVFHYHATEWIGCYDETSGGVSGYYYTDDAAAYDVYDTQGGSTIFTSGATPGTPNASNNQYCKGTWVDGWFLTGHGNGGVFETPSSIGVSGAGSEGSPVWTTTTTALTVGQSAGASNASPFLSQTTAGKRYYYGTPGGCNGCN